MNVIVLLLWMLAGSALARPQYALVGEDDDLPPASQRLRWARTPAVSRSSPEVTSEVITSASSGQSPTTEVQTQAETVTTTDPPPNSTTSAAQEQTPEGRLSTIQRHQTGAGPTEFSSELKATPESISVTRGEDGAETEPEQTTEGAFTAREQTTELLEEEAEAEEPVPQTTEESPEIEIDEVAENSESQMPQAYTEGSEVATPPKAMPTPAETEGTLSNSMDDVPQLLTEGDGFASEADDTPPETVVSDTAAEARDTSTLSEASDEGEEAVAAQETSTVAAQTTAASVLTEATDPTRAPPTPIHVSPEATTDEQAVTTVSTTPSTTAPATALEKSTSTVTEPPPASTVVETDYTSSTQPSVSSLSHQPSEEQQVASQLDLEEMKDIEDEYETEEESIPAEVIQAEEDKTRESEPEMSGALQQGPGTSSSEELVAGTPQPAEVSLEQVYVMGVRTMLEKTAFMSQVAQIVERILQTEPDVMYRYGKHNVTTRLSELTVTGVDKLNITTTNIDLDRMNLNVTFEIPQIRFSGKFNASGSISGLLKSRLRKMPFSFPKYGHGDIRAVVSNTRAFGHAKLVHSPNEMTVAIAPLTCSVSFDKPAVQLVNAVIPPVLKKMQFTELFKAALSKMLNNKMVLELQPSVEAAVYDALSQAVQRVKLNYDEAHQYQRLAVDPRAWTAPVAA